MTTTSKVFIVIALALLVASFVGATQYAAAHLSFDRRLGPPVFVVTGTPVYTPWAWIGWARRFEQSAPRVFAVAQAINFGGALVAFVPFLVAVALARGGSDSTVHGSARWAERKDLRRAGLLAPAGVVLCQTSDARYT